jgi:fermentation-respiration switch protein FrsA (DUF1100 family)
MKIVPGRSIGGVTVGMDAMAAVKKWGPGGSCATAIGVSCRWDGTMKKGKARFDVVNGKVSNIVLEAGQKPGNFYPVYKGPITKWKTSKGIGIGSYLRTVGKKYPKAKPDGSGLLLQSGKRQTFFESSLGRVASIAVTKAP